MWQRRQWGDLLNLIDHLPQNSFYVQAISEDEELAREHLARLRDDEKQEDTFPPMSTWSPEVSQLASVVDAVNRLTTTLIAVNMEKGKKPPVIKPARRPRLAIESVKAVAAEERSRAQHARLTALVMAPGRPRMDEGEAAEGATVTGPSRG